MSCDQTHNISASHILTLSALLRCSPHPPPSTSPLPCEPVLISGEKKGNRGVGGEAIYSNHRDLARAPQSPQGLIGNQRDGGYKRRERNKLYLNFRFVEQTSSIPNPKQLCREIVLLVGGRDEEDMRVVGLPVTVEVLAKGVWKRSVKTGRGCKCTNCHAAF